MRYLGQSDFMEMESGAVGPEPGGRGEWRVVVNRYGVSVLQDEKIPGDGWILNINIRGILERRKNVYKEKEARTPRTMKGIV